MLSRTVYLSLIHAALVRRSWFEFHGSSSPKRTGKWRTIPAIFDLPDLTLCFDVCCTVDLNSFSLYRDLIMFYPNAVLYCIPFVITSSYQEVGQSSAQVTVIATEWKPSYYGVVPPSSFPACRTYLRSPAIGWSLSTRCGVPGTCRQPTQSIFATGFRVVAHDT